MYFELMLSASISTAYFFSSMRIETIRAHLTLREFDPITKTFVYSPLISFDTMAYRKVKDEYKKENQLLLRLNDLASFSKRYNLSNVLGRVELIIEKIAAGKDIHTSVIMLKIDLLADILGADYYDKLGYVFIPASNTVEYKTAWAINQLDQYIFGGKQNKISKKLSPLDFSIPSLYTDYFNNANLNLIDNLAYL